MTDQQHPITPPPELVQQWLCSDDYLWGPLEQTSITITANRLQNIATAAAQWGADQELEACCLLLDDGEHAASYGFHNGDSLHAARRPKPPSLKEQALKALERQSVRSIPSLVSNNDCDTIRRALEALPND